MRCRKNYRDLTSVERDRLVQGLYHLKSTGIIDQFANDHVTFFHDAHHSSHFLPWHREFLRRFEDALRSFHPDITIPYWNSTVDTSPSDPLWDNNFLGQFDAAWGLGRALGSVSLPTPQQVQTVLDLNTYDKFWPPLEGGIHGPPHNWVSGIMATSASPGDPVFYLHHCWIDMLWAQWQLQNPGAPFVSSGMGRGLSDPMQPWTTTPADVMDHHTINLYHYLPSFQQDLPQVTLDTPNIIFLDVPEGETRMSAVVFNFNACGPIHFTIVSGPTVTSGPPTTIFGIQSSVVTADPAIDYKARVWLIYTGTNDGDMATGTVTIRCDETGELWNISLSANTIARKTAAVVLVLDQSNSMTFDSGIASGIKREHVLKFSAPPAVDVLEDDHAMAICSFDHDAHPGIGMTSVSGSGRLNINATISGYAPNTNGWTSIGEGVFFAHNILEPVSGYDVKALVVLTDGQENHGPHTRRYIADVADIIHEHVFAIGLGRPEVLNAGALQALCNGNNGYMLMTGDLNTDTYFRLAKFYQQIIAGVTNNEIVKDPEGWIKPGEKHRIPYWINETDLSAKFILLTPAPNAIRFMLETPNGDLIDPSIAGPHPMATFEMGNQVSLYRIGLPLPINSNDAHIGLWHIILTIDEKSFKRYLSSLDNYPDLYATAAAHGVRYSSAVHAYSNLRMKVNLFQTTNEPGATITVRSILTEYGIPVTFRANCHADLVRPDNTTTMLLMPEVEPGVFQTTTNASMPGIYRFNILIEGKTLRGHPFSREQLLTGAVWRGGDNADPSSKDDTNTRNDRFCGLIDCLLHQNGIQEALHKLGINSEELNKCFEDYCRKPSPGELLNIAKPILIDRLRVILQDDKVLQKVIQEIDKEKK
jgi:hypothetical protein